MQQKVSPSGWHVRAAADQEVNAEAASSSSVVETNTHALA
jgi:hypothetical protein